jgi:DNA-binding FadR family transcriptional regulator
MNLESLLTKTDPVDTARPMSQTESVVEGIKHMITSGTLAAGSRLPIEKDLAQELNVSRGSLREAVRALCVMGVLETRQGDGTYVTSLEPGLLLSPVGFMVDLHSANSSADLQSVRRVLETEAAGRAAPRFSPGAQADAEVNLAGVDQLLAQGKPFDHEAIMEADIEFHRIIAQQSGSPTLEALIEALGGRTIRGRLWRALSEEDVVYRTHDEHRAILHALAEHDPDAARLRMGVHLLGVQDFLADHPEASAAG